MRLGIALLLCVAIIGCGVKSIESERATVDGQSVAGQPESAGPPSQPNGVAAPNANAGELTISLIRAQAVTAADIFEIAGVPERDLIELTKAELNPEQWSALFSVRVVTANASNDADRPPVAGAYRVEGSRIQFRPTFPLEPGLRYRARFDLIQLYAGLIASTAGGNLAGPPELVPIVMEFSIPKPTTAATTAVSQVYPTVDTLPENQLKFYLHFSAPMSRGEAYRRIQLLDASGEEIRDPFLELDEELWDREGKRFTLFLDPGRIKRGLKPREEVGPVFEDGKSYTLVIDHEWLDAAGNPLRESFRKQFRVGPPDDQQPDPNTWKLQAPLAGTTEPLVVKFPEPYDHAMLHRVLVVRDSANTLVRGEIQVDEHETRWRLTPAAAWSAGDFTVEVQTDLEDLAGNSIARVFDVDLMEPISRSMKAETWSLPFRVAP